MFTSFFLSFFGLVRPARFQTLALAIVALGGISSLGHAQGGSDSESLTLEEVVITAQRRAQSLQDVPISVSAFTADTLQRANITEAAEYLIHTPNVGFSEDGEGGSRNISVAIRGVSNITLDGIAVANSIGYYIDELSVGSVAQGTINPQLQDMERIEVLRGPQGTYYGRNAVGGAINITTNKPNEEFYAEGTLSAGNFGTYGVEGIVNMPINDTFMARIVAAYEESDSPVENESPTGNDLGYEYTTTRLSLRALPSDALTLDLSITYTKEDEGGDISVGSGVLDLDTQDTFGFGSASDALDPDPSTSNNIGFYPDNDDKVFRDTPELNDKEFTIVNGRIVWDLGASTFHSITGLVDSEFDREADLDGGAQLVGPLPLRRVNAYEGESFSQEFRWQSADDSTLDWVVGAFYAKDEIDQSNQIQILPKTNPAAATPTGYINRNVRSFETTSIAVFGEATWHVSDALSLTAGGRYSDDDIESSDLDQGRVANTPSNLLEADDILKGDESFSDFSPRLVARYIPNDDLTFYGSISKGYKAGGVDVTGASRTAPRKYDSEDLWNYEAGFKSQLMDGRMSLSGALFAMEWTDFQVQTNRLNDPTDIASAIETTQNADEASSIGVELEMVTLLSEGLTWSLGLGYIDAEFDKFEDAILKGNTNSNPHIVDVSGQPLIKTPEWSANSALDYAFALGDYEAFFRAEWFYRDETVGDIEGVGSMVGRTVTNDPFTLPDFPYQIDSYSVFNLRFGLSNERFRVSAWVKNALDEDYYNGTSDNFGASGIRIRPHHREFGAKVTYMMGN